ncbi:3-carboxy-cis,cis-muconate cycloisomerase [Bradyrhizobium archetypum]|uniref:3-carboxy-cis,cis-muconate cycloisomerase n=1 Tax=Bradyrhizobium archetypum TaxID=2721160 RepID=A0A7Y4M595_9BRAD|nr:3-carboxy-cis,cis-muconate cycloisomerase [Bradyrhizobium archetypum]NOJ50339.1 3-carboxy-cis,cis-muconate cycloisomerase [Bradyrhizobium archetypum]
MFDNALYRDVFSTPAMRAVFSDDAQLRAYVQAEVALATAQGETGVIPSEAAETIARQAPAIALDIEQLKCDTENVGYPIVGLVRQLSEQLGEAGRYLHWGATTQDIMDTATVLQLREAVVLIDVQLAEVMTTLANLARLHRDTVMAGRTHLQQALPITFGHKAAVWLSALQRSAERLAQAKPRALQAQLGGAAGTLASLGERGLEVRAAYARALDLAEPDITWHVARDGLVELAQALAVICGALGKIGYDVMILMATEIGEVFEPFSSHRGASSTMPQKRNPISSEILLANAKASRDAASLMLDAMVQDLERATGPWHCEWLALPRVCLLTAGSLAQAQFMLSGLIVDPAAMQRNLDSTRGLIVAEAVMMGLAPALGRQTAHDEVYAACRYAFDHGDALLDALLRRPAIASALPRDRLAALCEPSNYLGTAGAMVDRVLARQSKR